MADTNVFNNERVHVMPERCSTCIFRPGNLMHLQGGRVKDMVEGAVSEQGVIPCHKTIHGQRDQQAVCRGFYDSYGDQVPALFLATAMGMIEEVDPA